MNITNWTEINIQMNPKDKEKENNKFIWSLKKKKIELGLTRCEGFIFDFNEDSTCSFVTPISGSGSGSGCVCVRFWLTSCEFSDEMIL